MHVLDYVQTLVTSDVETSGPLSCNPGSNFLRASGGSVGKEFTCNEGDVSSVPESGRSPGEGNGYSLQFTCLGNPGTEEPGRLQSMGSQRIVHGLVSKEQFLNMH